MERMTREEYLQQREAHDIAMHETKIREREAIRSINVHYDDRIRELEHQFRKDRDALLLERDAKKDEVTEKFKDERRRIWMEDCEMVSAWRAQLISENTPPISGGGQHDGRIGV